MYLARTHQTEEYCKIDLPDVLVYYSTKFKKSNLYFSPRTVTKKSNRNNCSIVLLLFGFVHQSVLLCVDHGFLIVEFMNCMCVYVYVDTEREKIRT